MGRVFANEVELRKYAKEVKSLILEHHDIDKAVEIIREHEEILSYDYGRSTYLSLLPTVRYEKGLRNKYLFLKKLVEVGFEIYERKNDYEELIFFAAAKSDLEKIQICMKNIKPENYNKTKEGNTILLYLIKYGDLENANYIDALKLLVNEYRVDVNKADYKNHSPILILLSKFASLHEKNIPEYNDIILNGVSIILTRNTVDLTSHKINDKTAQDIIECFHLKDVLEELKVRNRTTTRIRSEKTDDRDDLFTLISEKKEDEFLQKISQMVFKDERPYDIQDGNNTLLQLACEKNLRKVTSFLLEKGADSSKVTRRNKKTPLEIAARRNYHSIFKCILNDHKMVIDNNLFGIFLVNRGRQIKTKYFDEILCYDGLQLDVTYQNGNTPLHYAIIFSNTEAVLKLLRRGASLSIKNKQGKSPLDYISKEDLELYMDDCILLDNHYKTHNSSYELGFDFSGFVTKNSNSKVLSEVEIACKICSSERLKPLAKHPLMMTFIEIKWNTIAPFYNKILLLYAFFFVYSLVLSVYLGHVTFLYLLIILVLVYCTVQPPIFKNIKQEGIVSGVLLIAFTFIVYYLCKSIEACILFFVLMMFYQFLQQHLSFSKFQALIVNGFRRITPYMLGLFALHYFTNKSDRGNFQLNLIIIFIVGYIIVVTHSFNALADSITDIEYSFKTIYNKNALKFIKFYENVFLSFKTFLEDPFVYKTFEIKRGKRHRLNFYVNKNKFVGEELHFFKLDVLTVRKLQNLVVKRNQNASS